MGTKKVARKNQDTYVYIDVSNIRAACLKTLGFMMDFTKLLRYFQGRYPNLKEVRYYEGLAKDDVKKRKVFSSLRRKGYIICALQRKMYNSVENEVREIRCPKCKNKWVAKFTRKHKALKSNVDVYLASDMLVQASKVTEPTRLILVSCDGDYAEAIRNMVSLNENVSVSVLATPYVRDMSRNTCSVRLRCLLKEISRSRYSLNYIDEIEHKISLDK